MPKVVGEYFIKEGQTGSQLCQVVEADKNYRQASLQTFAHNLYTVCFLLVLFAVLWLEVAYWWYLDGKKQFSRKVVAALVVAVAMAIGVVVLVWRVPSILAGRARQAITQDICLPLESFEQYDQFFKKSPTSGD